MRTSYSAALVGRLIDRHLPLRIRAAALMSAAVLAVHQLRFQLAFGAQADDRLAAQGHQYLGTLTPLAAMLVAIGAGLFLAELARAWRYGAGRHRARRPTLAFSALWLLAAVALLAIYASQELLEGALASGHPGGLAGVFGAGGFWAIPLSVMAGALVALALRASEAAIGLAAKRPAAARIDSPTPSPPRPHRTLLARSGPMAEAAPGRAPPLFAATNF
jgi:hypothetical protein